MTNAYACLLIMSLSTSRGLGKVTEYEQCLRTFADYEPQYKQRFTQDY